MINGFLIILSLVWIIYVLIIVQYKCVESDYILERGDIVESDHTEVGTNVEWKVKRRGKYGTKRKLKQKKKDEWKRMGGLWESNGKKRI